MPTFVMFGKYSSGAVEEISAERTVKAAGLVSNLGGEIKAGYALPPHRGLSGREGGDEDLR
jgi:hypothetical protein